MGVIECETANGASAEAAPMIASAICHAHMIADLCVHCHHERPICARMFRLAGDSVSRTCHK